MAPVIASSRRPGMRACDGQVAEKCLTRSGRGLIAAPHDDVCDHPDRRSPPHSRGMGGRLRLRQQPLPPDIFPRHLSQDQDTRSSGGSFAKQEFAKMYTPPPFKSDRAKAIAFAQARGFGTMCAFDGARPVASALPFCVSFAADGTPIVSFHVARGNALARLGDGKSRWLLAVNGADAYVSGDWYASPDQ